MSAPWFCFLDDERMPKDVTWVDDVHWLAINHGSIWTIVRDYAAFTDTITKRGLPAYISFDHDLGIEMYDDYREAITKSLAGAEAILDYDAYKVKSGYHCAQWLVAYCLDRRLKLPLYTVHSLNHIGKANIESLLEGFKGRSGR